MRCEVRRRRRGGFDGGLIEQRAQKGGAQQALPHGRLAAVEGVEERGTGGGVGEEGLDQLEVAHADGIELQMLGALVVAQAIDVREIAELRGADVMQCSAGGDGSGRMAGEAKAIERASAELAFEQGDSVVGAEGPCVETCLGADGIEGCGNGFDGESGEERAFGGEEEFGRLLAG